MHFKEYLFRRSGRNISDLNRFPDTVVLDLRLAINEFETEIYKLEEYEIDTFEIVEEILLYIGNKKNKDNSIEELGEYLKELHNDPRLGHFHKREYESTLISKAAMKLAGEVLESVLTFGLYTPEGILPYQLNCILDNQPVLKKSAFHFTTSFPLKSPTASVFDN